MLQARDGTKILALIAIKNTRDKLIVVSFHHGIIVNLDNPEYPHMSDLKELSS